MPTETEAREIGRAPRTLKEADIQIKLLNATNEQDFFDPKSKYFYKKHLGLH